MIEYNQVIETSHTLNTSYPLWTPWPKATRLVARYRPGTHTRHL